MTEPSDAAKRLAAETLWGKGGMVELPVGIIELHQMVNRLEANVASVLQEHSDVAKALRAAGCPHYDNAWKSLILPEEPLHDLTVVEGYQLKRDGTRARVRVALRDMRIVEAGDD